jgi:hypothetical protein
MNNNTKITSKKYKTIGELLQAPIKSIILVSNKEKDDNIKKYIFEWLYLNYYDKKEMNGSLTSRIKKIDNNSCYYYIIKNVFDNIDILQHNKTSKPILNSNCINFIKKIHTIEPSLTGTFLDYLMRRIICEKTNEIFYDSRAEIECDDMNIQMSISSNNKEFLFSKLPISMNDSYKNTKDTKLYKTKNILLEIFITSLSHTLAFYGIPNQDKINNIINLIQNTSNIIELFYLPLDQLCVELLNNKSDILLNPSLGGKIPLLNNKNIPSDCDIVINDILYDIKCTCGDNTIYEILQLLGYSALLNCVPKFNKKINNISIINLLQGYIINYDISYITKEQMINYLKILTK